MDLIEFRGQAKQDIEERTKEIFSDIPQVWSGGKHLRGTLCLLISEALSGNRDKALTSAAVVDALHAASLIHDDIVDEDAERRGSPSLWITNGIKRAVFIGDRVFAMAHKRMALIGNNETKEVSEALDTTVDAWAKEGASKPIELLIDLFTSKVTDVGYRKLCLTKTAPFFKAAARLGGISADSDLKTLNALSNYAESVGLAYQYADDMVDIIKLQQKKGMPSVKDLASVMPAIIHYNGKNLRQLFFEIPFGIVRDSLVGKNAGEKLVSLLSQLDVAEQLTMDIGKEVDAAVACAKIIDLKPEYKDMVEQYPLYAANLMLAEVDRMLNQISSA